MEVKMHWQVCSSSFFLPASAMDEFIANVGPGDVMAQFTQSQLIAQGTAANLSRGLPCRMVTRYRHQQLGHDQATQDPEDDSR